MAINGGVNGGAPNGSLSISQVSPAMVSGTGEVVTATSAAEIALINSVGLPGFSTLPSVVGAAAVSPYPTFSTLTVMAGDNSTNDQIAWRNLVYYLGTASATTGLAYTIYAPDGEYSIQNAGTTWISGVGVLGDGPNRTIFKLSCSNGNPTPLATFTGAFSGASATNYLADCTFEGFTIDGSGVSLSGAYNTGPKGLGMQWMVRPTFRDLIIQNCGASGLGCDHMVDYVVDNVRCYNNGRLWQPTVSTSITGASYTNGGTITVGSTSGFAAAGTLNVPGIGLVTYSAIGSPTTFTGTVGTSGTITTGTVIGTAAYLGGAGFGIGTGGWSGSTTTDPKTGILYAEGGTFSPSCIAKGNGTHGLFFELQNNAYTLPKGHKVFGGTYTGNQFGISDWGCDGLKVLGADLLGNLQHGFNVNALGDGQTAGKGGIIDDCVVFGNGLDGICIGDSAGDYQVGAGNKVSGNGRHGTHYLNVVNAASSAMPSMTCKVDEVFSNGGAAVAIDAALSNMYMWNVVGRNNWITNGAAVAASTTSVYTALTITDSGQAWTTNSQAGKTVTVAGQAIAVVKSNTATVLTLWPYQSNGSTAWSGGTPANGTAYTLPAAVALRGGLYVNATVSHPDWRACRFEDDNGTRIQLYGLAVTSSGSITSAEVSDIDLLGNLTASYINSGTISGGTWTNASGMSAGVVGGSPTAMLTDGPGAFTGYVQIGNGTTLGGHVYSGSGAPTLSATASDWYLRTDGTPGSTNNLYKCTGTTNWTALV